MGTSKIQVKSTKQMQVQGIGPTVQKNIPEDIKESEYNGEKKKELLKAEETDLIALWKIFRDDTSMHGLKHSTFDGGYKLRWIIWIVAIIAMVSFLSWTLWTQLQEYSQNPTLTNLGVHHMDELPFPAVTICNLSPYKMSSLNMDAELSQYYLSRSRLHPFVSEPDLSAERFNISGNSTFLETASFSVNDIVLFCVYQNVLENCDQVLTSRITEMGKCFTFNNYNAITGIRTISRTGSLLSLTLYLRIDQDEYVYNDVMAAGVKFLVHDPHEEPDMVNLGYLASPGYSVNAAIKMTKSKKYFTWYSSPLGSQKQTNVSRRQCLIDTYYKYLPTPYLAFGDGFCLDTKSSSFKNHLKYYEHYSESACLRECKRDIIVGKCGCRKHTDPGNETICSMADLYSCYDNESYVFNSDISALRSCKCPKPCEFTQYTALSSSAVFPAKVYDAPLTYMGMTNLREDYIELNIFYESLTYQYVEQIPQFTIESIIGILGGQMGIFLGASLLTLSELVEFGILSLYVLLKRLCIKIRGKNIVTTEKYPDGRY